MKRAGRKSAFTLVEMTAALVLTTLLLSAIFEVVSLLARDSGEKEPSRSRDQAVDRFLAALRKDLESAWRMRADGGIELLTYRSLAGPPKPLLVEYEVVDGEFLVRRERDLASLSSEDTRSELVLSRVAELDAVGLARGLAEAPAPGGEPARSARPEALRDMRAVPDRVTLALRSLEGDGEPRIRNLVLVLRSP